MSARRAILAAVTAAIAAPLGLAGLALRPRWRVGLRERLGRPPAEVGGEDRPLWIHAASAGEVLAASPLVARWRAEGRSLYATATSLTGRVLWASRHSDVASGLAPLDHPWCVDRTLDAVRPRALVLVETELWPVLIAAASRRGVPVVLVSARISPGAFRRYDRLRRFGRPTLARLAAVGAATEADGERFTRLGVPAARLRLVGDLKLDSSRSARPPADDLRRALADGPVWVAGSTHRGEERAVADVLDRLEAEGLAPRMVVAPRHLERLESVEREWAERGRKVRRRSRLGAGPLAPGEVLLVDTMGELASIYGLADFAFVGGSLTPVGGHNLMEPVAAGVPVLHGPHVENVAHAARRLGEVGAVRPVADTDELARVLSSWLRDPETPRRGVLRGQGLLERESGSVERAAALVESVLRGAPWPEPAASSSAPDDPSRPDQPDRPIGEGHP